MAALLLFLYISTRDRAIGCTTMERREAPPAPTGAPPTNYWSNTTAPMNPYNPQNYPAATSGSPGTAQEQPERGPSGAFVLSGPSSANQVWAGGSPMNARAAADPWVTSSLPTLYDNYGHSSDDGSGWSSGTDSWSGAAAESASGESSTTGWDSDVPRSHIGAAEKWNTGAKWDDYNDDDPESSSYSGSSDETADKSDSGSLGERSSSTANMGGDLVSVDAWGVDLSGYSGATMEPIGHAAPGAMSAHQHAPTYASGDEYMNPFWTHPPPNHAWRMHNSADMMPAAQQQAAPQQAAASPPAAFALRAPPTIEAEPREIQAPRETQAPREKKQIQQLAAPSGIAEAIENMALSGNARDRSTLQNMWQWAELLLREDHFKFDQRPFALGDTDRGVFREGIKVRRMHRTGRDKWQNSGGKKGSTVWPFGEECRLRCQYGKITREGLPPLRYQQYVFIPGKSNFGDHEAEYLQRRLYVVVPVSGPHRPREQTSTNKTTAGEAAASDAAASGSSSPGSASDVLNELKQHLRLPGDVKPKGPLKSCKVDSQSSMASYPSSRVRVAEPPRPVVNFDTEIDELVASLEASAGAFEKIDINAVYRLLCFVTQQTYPPLRYQRPDVLGGQVRQIYVQATSCRRRVDSRQGEEPGAVDHFDRWVNGGGKRAVVRLEVLDGTIVQRRAGRIQRISNPDREGDGDLRYHQYSIESSYTTDGGPKKRVRGGVTMYHIYVKNDDQTAVVEKRERAAVVRTPSLDSEAPAAAGAEGQQLSWLDGPKRVRTPSVRLATEGDL